MLTDDQITDWPDLRDRLDRAQATIAAAVDDRRRLTREEVESVSDALNMARAALREGQSRG